MEKYQYQYQSLNKDRWSGVIASLATAVWPRVEIYIYTNQTNYKVFPSLPSVFSAYKKSETDWEMLLLLLTPRRRDRGDIFTGENDKNAPC